MLYRKVVSKHIDSLTKMHLVNLIVQLRRKCYPPWQTSVWAARSWRIKSVRPLFGAELVDDFRACTRRIDLLFAAMRTTSLSPLIETIVCRSAVNPSARWLSLPFSHLPPLPGRTCDTQVHAIGISHFRYCTPVDPWSRWSPLARSFVATRKIVEKALCTTNYKLTNIDRTSQRI